MKQKNHKLPQNVLVSYTPSSSKCHSNFNARLCQGSIEFTHLQQYRVINHVSLVLQNWLVLILPPLMNDSPTDMRISKIASEFQSLYVKRHITVLYSRRWEWFICLSGEVEAACPSAHVCTCGDMVLWLCLSQRMTPPLPTVPATRAVPLCVGGHGLSTEVIWLDSVAPTKTIVKGLGLWLIRTQLA